MSRFVKIGELLPAKAITLVLLSEGGVRLLEKGERLDDRIFDVLREFDFKGVVVADSDEDAEAYIREKRHKKVPVSDLNVGDRISFKVRDESGTTIVPSGTKLKEADIDLLVNAGVHSVWTPLPEDDAQEARDGRLLLKLQQIKNSQRAGAIDIDTSEHEDDGAVSVEISEDRLVTDMAEITEQALDERVDAASEEELTERPDGPSLAGKIQTVDSSKIRALGSVKAMVHLHGDVVSNAEQAYAQVRKRQKVSGVLINALCTSVINGLLRDRNMTLNLSGLANSEHYVVRHAINTTLLTSNIAVQLGFSAHQVQEILFGAFLHDIGMMLMPSEITSKTEKLTPEEWIVMKTHPTKGLNALQGVTHLPRTTALVVYQEQERCDGSGYPRHRSRGLIHTYAKIVTVASVYDALTAKRPYRKAMLPYRAMETMLKMVNAGKLEAEPARALVHTLGLFPVGSWVRLEDRRVARVIAANGDKFTRPVVSVVINDDGKQLEKPQPINLAEKSNHAVNIAAPIPRPNRIEGDVRTIGF
ncbi:MAG: HD domain-containing protein [Planctomycetes bacterium]|nr:HD domain-containing protein [Planctomycetota bacterium]